ncbi:alpha/beta-hydrolase [Anaeromyces robustus]|uniref:Pheromone-processing carboxypeptidase KEX1 n=1 Tax=Anaeromyces robustus TaxID=1754192 RepID=A0A1Y1XFN3_9FUNG|nr:alpha/beta-hydrolase [Anaeromyces robustus]|eukprot:ORX84226.1 alpha/beta-hydrolase [Anaeromyces robustus]
MNISIIYLIVILISILVKAQLTDLPEVPKAEEFIVSKIPDIDTSNITQHAGLIPIRTNTYVFFWLFDKEEKATSDREILTIWLNGGSMDGVFMENGPYTFDENDEIIRNPYNWNKHSSIVYVDQPTGTGFSYTKNNDIPRSEVAVAKDFNTFLGQFFKVFPQYKNAEIYIAGESFAGTYIPYIASNLINNPVNGEMINLKGIAIGNGWIDPLRQYQGYLKYSTDNNLLNENSLLKTKQLVEKCTDEYKKSDKIKNYQCEYILDTILNGSTANGQFCINMYDIRLRDNDNKGGCGLYSWPLTLNAMTKYLRRQDVIQALHVQSTPHTWTECTSRVSSALSGDSSPPSYTLLPEILEHIKVTLFVGDKDLICNHVGIEMMIDNLTWNGVKGFQNDYIDWVVNGKINGLYQSERNLTYILLTNGSHMVPIDLPEESLAMYNSIIDIHVEEKASLDDSFDYAKGQKKLSDSNIPDSSSNVSKILSFSFLGVCLVAGVALFSVRKNRQHNRDYDVEWHELDENEELDHLESDDNAINIDIDDDASLIDHELSNNNSEVLDA